MHGSVHVWFNSALSPEEVSGRSVLEAGSFNENGSVREYVQGFAPSSYIGTDMRHGPGVDVMMKAEDLPKLSEAPGMLSRYDIVISTEMLEHAENWQGAFKGMIDILGEGGLLLITTRSKGFAFHSYPHDYWRYSLDSMRRIIEGAGLEIIRLDNDPDCPGVFLKARKPAPWDFPQENPWDGITLDPPC